MDTISNSLQQMQGAEEATVNKALEQILGRQAGVEDYKKCLKISVSGNPEKWYLRYAGINMGWIERKMQWEGMALKYVCTFIPDNVSPEKEPAIFDEKLSSYAVLSQRSDSEVASDYERGFKDGWNQATSQGIKEVHKYQ